MYASPTCTCTHTHAHSHSHTYIAYSIFDVHGSDWFILDVLCVPLLIFFRCHSNTVHLPKSPEREQWMFLCMKNRRGLRSFSISTNLLLSCLPWCVCYHRKRLQHFVYLTFFNIKAQLKCCNESWISLLWRLWALTHAYTPTHLHMCTLADTHRCIHNNTYVYKTVAHFTRPRIRIPVHITFDNFDNKDV